MQSTVNHVRAAWTAAVLGVASLASAQQGQWSHYSGDLGSTKYSDADQINRDNVNQLEIAWRWESPDNALAKEKGLPLGQFKGTPILVDGLLYVSTRASQVAAVNPATGETVWVHDPKSYERGRPTNSGFQHRGVTYWADGEDRRIFIATGGRQLVALNAKTGETVAGFGEGGTVDLNKGLGREFAETQVGYNAPVTICRDTIVIGSIIFDGPIRKEMPPGHVRGYDVRTGELKWVFHTIPEAGEFGNETWEDDSWKYTGNTNVWSMISADEELGYVYLPLSTPTNDWYGGHRKGNNLFAESLVCLDAATGKRVWHFQAVHHGLWDYDFPAAPILADIRVDGKPIKAVAQISKQGWVYMFDRATGEPVWPIEERPAPQSTVPGEQTSPTQPFPTKPPAFERQGITDDDIIDFTPELRAEAMELLKKYTHGPIFTPPSVTTPENLGSIQVPGAAGGANWCGAGFDPETGILYIPSNTMPSMTGLRKPDANRSNFDFMHSGQFLVPGPQGLPIVKPPYGRITAMDLNKGEILWQVANAEGPQDHPALKGLDLPRLGYSSAGYISSGGPVLTKTLLFVSQVPRDEKVQVIQKALALRAFDKKTGEEVWKYPLDKAPYAVPMTYMHQGRQYLVVGVGGDGQPAELLAFALSQ